MGSEELKKQMSEINAGDHLVFLYKGEETFFNVRVIIAYIVSRVLRNERIFYISGDLDNNLLMNEINKSDVLREALKNNQLSILKKEDAYSKDGDFDPDKMVDLLKSLAEESIKIGYKAFAVTGEIGWVLKYDDGFERIMHYENSLNENLFGKYPVSAICRYNIDYFSDEMIKNIINVHPIVIWEGLIHENPFYFEPADTDDSDKYYVEKMLENIVRYSNDQNKFKEILQKSEEEYKQLQLNIINNMIVTLSGLLETHDKYTINHSERVADIAKDIAVNLGMDKKEVSEVYYAGLVHDIGKILIPGEILNKPGKLTSEEYDVVKKHSDYGYSALSKSPELMNIADIVLQHHERVDGNGYPAGLKSEEILTAAKIICIADSFEAMTSKRSYRKSLSNEEAIQEIQRCAGIQFDEKIANVAIKKVLRYL